MMAEPEAARAALPLVVDAAVAAPDELGIT